MNYPGGKGAVIRQGPHVNQLSGCRQDYVMAELPRSVRVHLMALVTEQPPLSAPTLIIHAGNG